MQQEKQRGRFLILSYDTNVDIVSVASPFEELNFDIDYHNDLTYEETVNIFNEESKYNYANCNCYALCVFARCENGGFYCNDKLFSLDKMIGQFNDVAIEGYYSIHIRNRIPKFFFINNYPTTTSEIEIIDNIKPFSYIIRKSHFCICYNTYPVSWLINTLCSLCLLYKGNLNLSEMLTQISGNITNFSPTKRRGLKPEDFTRLSCYDPLKFRRLLFKCFTNSIESFKLSFEEKAQTQLNDLAYEMKPDIIGHCLILNYKSMEVNFETQEAAHKDVELLSNIFKELKFEVEVENDLTAAGTDIVLTEKSKLDKSSMNCFVLFIIAECKSIVLHGIPSDVFICGKDNNFKETTFKIDDLAKHFSQKNCPTLAGIPKLIFIQHWNGVMESDHSALSMVAYTLFERDYLNSYYFDLPNDCIFFLSPRIGRDQFQKHSTLIHAFQKILRDHSHKYDLLTMLHMLIIGLNFNSDCFYIDLLRNFCLKSTLTKLFFFNTEKLKKYFQDKKTTKNILKLYPLGEGKPILNCCFILDYQNCHQDILDKIEINFQNLNFVVRKFSDLTFKQTSDLLEREAKLVNDHQVPLNVIDRTCMVFCIFADCKFDKKKLNVQGSFECQDKSINIYRIISYFFNYLNNPGHNRIPVFILINDRKVKVNPDLVQSFCHLSLSTYVYVSFNTYPDSWFIHQLWKVLRLKTASVLNLTQLLTKIYSENFALELQTEQDNIGLEPDLTIQHIKQFKKIILEISTNSLNKEKIVSMSDSEVTYEMTELNKGECLILQYDLNENFVQIEKICEDVKMLEETFCMLGFEVNSYKNLTSKDTIDLLNRKSQEFCSCFVLCLITRLENGFFYCTDKKISLNTVMELFDMAFMEDIPKIFIIEDVFESKFKDSKTIDAIELFLPDEFNILPKNYLFVYSSYNPEQSLYALSTFLPKNSPNSRGSWFIQSLCKLVKNCSDKYDLLTMLRIITLQMCEPIFIRTYWRNYRSYPNVHIKSTLIRMIFFKTSFDASNVNANLSSVNRTFRTVDQEVELLTRRDALFYNNGKGRCIVVKCRNDAQRKMSTINSDDVALLKSTFEGIGFDVNEDEVFDRDSMKKLLLKESKRNHCDYSCLVLFLLVDGIISTDLNRDQLTEYFTRHWSLVGKPKLLFVLGIQNNSSPETISDNDLLVYSKGTFRIPKFADFMLFFCEHVSITIQLLCNVLSEYCNSIDLMSLLSIIIRRMTFTESKTSQIIPCINSTLTRLLVLGTNLQSQIPDENFILPESKVFFVPPENRGKCIIFNYKTFDIPGLNLSEREGTEKDVEALETVFGKHLQFIVQLHNQLCAEETLNELNKADFSSLECVVLCFLSHGSDNGILYCKDKAINKDHLVKSLAQNKSLQGKPKFIFIQACQGSNRDPGILVTDATNISLSLPIYDQADLFVFSSSYPGHLSYRDSNGSWFIQSLCEVLFTQNNVYDVATIAAIVSRMVAYRSDDNDLVKQIPFVHSTLTRPFMFS